MKKIFTLKWLFALFLLSVFSFVTDKNVTSNITSTIGQGIYFCPAYPGKIVYTNPDGSTINIFLKGDESLHWAKTVDGFTIIQDEEGTYFYAEQDSNGNLVRSDIKANDPTKRTGMEQSFLSSKSKDLSYSSKQLQTVKSERESITKTDGPLEAFPTGGTRKVLMILMDFQDKPFAFTKTDFENMMNLENYNGTGSFKDFYESMSYGTLHLQTVVTPIYHATGTMAKYGANVGTSKYINARQFVQEAVDAAHADGIDFSQFDNDGDGVCDGVIVVHSGYGEEAGASPNTLWSHKWSLGALARNYNGVLVDAYNVDPELSGSSGSAMTNIGVICHEFGHALGLPDLYDIDYSGAFDAGNWDLMAGGSWNNNGITPSSLSVWCKTFLGWSSPTVISTPGTGKTVNSSVANNSFFRVNSTTDNEYFLIENRQKTLWDQYIPGHGMVIWHIDDNWNASHRGVNDDPTHQGVDLVEADNIQTAATVTGDPFPGTANVTSFTDLTTPNSKSWAGKSTWKPIVNIAENLGVVSFDFMQNMPTTDATITGITAPAGNTCGLTSTETITVVIKNNATTDITTGSVSFQINALTPVSETFNITIAAGASAPYTFTATADLSVVGSYTIKSTVTVTGDGNTDNDVYSKSIINFPVALATMPFTEDFEGTFPPTNWTILNPDNSTTWAQAAIAGNGASTKAAKMDCWNYTATGQLDGLVTPKIDLSGATQPTLTFKVAYHMTAADGLGVYVSTNSGATFTKVYYKEGSELQTTTNYDPSLGMTPATANEWRLESIDLTPYVGSSVMIKFESFNNFGDNLYIDDVAVSEPSCVTPTLQAKDFNASALALTSLTANWTRGNGAGVIVVYKQDTPVDFSPVNGTDYTSLVGTDLGTGNILAYVGTGTTNNITGLNAAKTYYFAIYEYSATNCYKVPSLVGTAATLGTPSVVTRTITNINILAATIGGEVTSDGGDVVTERGFVWNTAGKATLADNHIAVGAGVGTFQQAITLSKLATYYVRTYATNSYGTVYGNDLSFTPTAGCDKMSFASTLSQIVTGGAYTDLGTDGSAITVANNDNANSSAIDIGFPFNFNCGTFSKFILNTNGFIKLGDTPPSTAALFYSTYSGMVGGVFNSTSLDDINFISPFNHDLTAGTGTPEFRVYTEGTTPNRITTVQFKNLSDKVKTGGPVQYSNLSFQIKLYETTNVIEFVYGTFTPTANASTFKTVAVGLRGFSIGAENTVCITKGSTSAWTAGSFLDGNYTGNAFNIRLSPVPTAGLKYRFTPRQANDISVKEVYTMAQLPLNYGAPHIVSAAISNEGTSVQTNIDVTLNITGANTFSPAVVNIPTINPGEVKVVSFASFTPSVTGANVITVSIPSDDINTNNTKSINQTVTTGTYSYSDPASTASSAYSGSFIGACKYHVTGTAYIASVDAMILNNAVMTGLTTTAYVMDASGAIIGQSNPFTVAAGNLGTWVTFTILTPPSITNADYYVGLSCAGGYFGSYQAENPSRSGAFFKIPVGGGIPSEFGNNARLMYRANAYPSLQTITFNALPAKVYGDADFDAGATTTSPLTVTYTSSNTAVATVTGSTIHIVGAGSTTIKASQAGDANYAPANSVSQTLTVSKATATINISNTTQTYDGLAKPVTTVTTPLGLTVNVTYDGSTTVPTNASTYAVVATINDANYQGTQSGSLTISKAELTITADNQTKTYGATNPTLTFHYSGFVNSETEAVLSTAPTAITSVDATTVVGTYNGAITVSGAVSNNYTFTYVDGNFTVTKAPLTITADDQTKVYGTVNPTLTFQYSGFVNNETASVLTTEPTANTTIDATTVVGVYTDAITVSGGVDENYSFSYVAGDFTITKATATINITNTTQTYDGSAKPVTTATTPVDLTVDVTYDGSATAPTNAGTYAVVATINDANYQGTQNGSLTISKATATITITNTTQVYNGTAKTVTVTTVPANLNYTVTYDGSVTAPTNTGNYAVVVTVNEPNYQGTQNATLQITPGTGVDPNDLNSIMIYSNTTDIFVEIPVLEGAAQLGIFNILGAQVHSTVNLIQGLNKIEGNFISGTYIVKVVVGKKVYTQKVLLK
ncbi:MAG: M6 family metalloprotease domain-containing protein [Bacteroidales bacterium]|nr:M6 family metalloprotease domain-containing protein [Bacteroidales bacterium]